MQLFPEIWLSVCEKTATVVTPSLSWPLEVNLYGTRLDLNSLGVWQSCTDPVAFNTCSYLLLKRSLVFIVVWSGNETR